MAALPGWDWHALWTPLMKIGIAWLIAIPMGWEREREAHSAGVRTFPIVAVASCGYTLVAAAAFDAAGLSRVLQGLVAGIGFVGGGAILKSGMTVHGTSAAASIWNLGAIGAAVGLGHYEIAIILGIVNMLSLWVLMPLRDAIRGKDKDAESGESQGGLLKS
jgi:putative Mg2+ transporter-C (MgtC) family protein